MAETKPEALTDEHLEYLDLLRESGEINMFGARPYLMGEFPWLSKAQAGDILAHWMDTFSKRHAAKEPK